MGEKGTFGRSKSGEVYFLVHAQDPPSIRSGENCKGASLRQKEEKSKEVPPCAGTKSQWDFLMACG